MVVRTRSEAQLVSTVSFMPERTVRNAALEDGAAETDPEKDNPFFKGVEERRYASPEYDSVELGSRAVRKLLEQTGTRGSEIDAVLVSCVFSDHFWPGVASGIQHRADIPRATVLNFDTGCSSFLSGINAACAYVDSGMADKVVVVTVTNFVSRLVEYQKHRKSWVLGDGATATLVARGEGNILSRHERSFGEHYGLFRFEPEEVEAGLLNYWERGSGPINVNFTKDMIDRIRGNALSLVPDTLGRALDAANLTPTDVDMLVTHQPNTFFLEEWRSRIGVPLDRCHDTLAKYGNLFQGSIPVTVADALEQGLLKRGDILAMSTFSMGGEFASAMTVRW